MIRTHEDAYDIEFGFLERVGSFNQATLQRNQVFDPDALLALRVNGVDLPLDAIRRRGVSPRPAISPLNYLRIPAAGAGLLLLIFLPGIIRQGAATYHAATGQTQEPFLGRWLLITAGLFTISAIAFALRLRRHRRDRSARSSVGGLGPLMRSSSEPFRCAQQTGG